MCARCRRIDDDDEEDDLLDFLICIFPFNPLESNNFSSLFVIDFGVESLHKSEDHLFVLSLVSLLSLLLLLLRFFRTRLLTAFNLDAIRLMANIL